MGRYVICGLATAIIIACLFTALASARKSVAPQGPPTTEEPIPFKRQLTPASGSMSRVALVFILSLGVGIGTMVVLKKGLWKKGLIGTVSDTRISVSEVKRISPKVTVFLVSVDDKEYLLVQGGEQVTITRHDLNAVMERPDAS